MMTRTLLQCALFLLVSPTLMCSWAAPAVPLRDPTQPPTTFGTPVGNVRLPIDRLRPEQLVTIDGVIYLVWNGRRYKAGETIDGARLERISESEVWLKRDGSVRKLPVFVGVEKRAPASGVANNPSTRANTDRKNGSTK